MDPAIRGSCCLCFISWTQLMACQVPLALSDLSVPTARELLKIIDSGTSITTWKHKGIFFTFTQTMVRAEWFSYWIILALPNCASAENVCRHSSPITQWWVQHKCDRFRMFFVSTFLFLYVCTPCSVNETAFKFKKFLTLQDLEKKNLLFVWILLPFFYSFLSALFCL